MIDPEINEDTMRTMKDTPEVPELRQRAEKKLAKAVGSAEPASEMIPEAVTELIYELSVHQIELDIQNEELRRAKLELEASRTRYFDLYDMAPVGYVTLSEKGLFLEANHTAAALLGAPKSALIKQPLTRFIIPEDQDIYYLHRKQAFETGAPRVCELRLVKTNGTPFWARMQATIAQDADGGPQYRVAIIDINEQKRAQDALFESEKSVRRLNEHILNMVMVMSHDIRGPIVAIGSILKLMIRGVYGKLGESPAGAVKDLLSRCTRLLGTAEDYLGKASVVGGLMQVECEALDLRQDIIDVVLDELADDIVGHGIAIDNRPGAIPAGCIDVSANKIWLKAVYRNLFSNAIKYGGRGCTISFGFESHESHYRLNVYNSGRPIAEEDSHKLFAGFGRSRTLNGSSSQGLGLGLHFIKKIILAHGGAIWYEAKADGSNFVFTLPKSNNG